MLHCNLHVIEVFVLLKLSLWTCDYFLSWVISETEKRKQSSDPYTCYPQLIYTDTVASSKHSPNPQIHWRTLFFPDSLIFQKHSENQIWPHCPCLAAESFRITVALMDVSPSGSAADIRSPTHPSLPARLGPPSSLCVCFQPYFFLSLPILSVSRLYDLQPSHPVSSPLTSPPSLSLSLSLPAPIGVPCSRLRLCAPCPCKSTCWLPAS